MSNCVAPYVTKTLNFANAAGGVLPGVQVIVKVYRVNDPAADPTLAGGFNTGGAPGVTSRYDDTAIEGLHCYRPEKGTIVTTEAFFTQDTFIPHFPGRYYETSVY
jgi:hypothetical protein